MNWDEDLLGDLELQEMPRRASRSRKSQPHTEAVPPFVVTQQPSQTESSKKVTTKSSASTLLSRLRLVVGVTMAIFSLCLLGVIALMWPIITSATSSVMSCDPPFITNGCAHIVPNKFATPGSR